MITLEEYLMGREELYPLTDEQKINAQETVKRINELLAVCNLERRVTSGYRPEAINAKIKNAAKKSKHITCQACDIEDKDRALSTWCLENVEILVQRGLWLENPDHTPTWVHLQIVPPGSGKRIFNP